MKLKKLVIFLIAAVMSLSIVSCSDKEEAGTFPDLTKTVESVKQYYGENVEFIFKADEYSEEVLMYSYGLMDEKYTEAVENFVLTECDGMSADTFAVIKFKSGTDETLIEEAAEVVKTEYVTALKNKLSAYNPEEFEASEGYQVHIFKDAFMLVISSEHAEEIVSVATGTEA